MMSQFLLNYYVGSYKDGFNRLRRSFNGTSKIGYGVVIPHWNDYPVLISNTIALEFRYNYKPNLYFLSFNLDNQEKNHASQTFQIMREKEKKTSKKKRAII